MTEHGMQRRELLQGAGAAALGMAAPPAVAAALPEPLAAFAAKTFAEALLALGAPLVPSPLVLLDAPAVADDGAFVPLAVTSTLPGTRDILLLVDGNPQPLAARFTIPAGTEAFVATRIRMAGSGTVVAVARTDAGLFAAAAAISVQVGACG